MFTEIHVAFDVKNQHSFIAAIVVERDNMTSDDCNTSSPLDYMYMECFMCLMNRFHII